ncbi:hypothetical protein K2173_019210 [Erythroxylum novogranatense]|uniref:Uncharacterized protein n=1 Tax=Erythroxylum novogranatense TaxID=1862640 RepID=A0AAV8SSY6_9ROSI|nr:hypothetical protein K2173_019210 [Erythroxylum novogranatense]
MADALLSVVLKQLASAVETGIQRELSLLFGGQNEAENLATTLTAIRSVLNDAEKKQVKESSVRVWLEELKSIAYHLEDVLDEWNTRISGPKIDRKLKHFPRTKSVRLISLCFCFNRSVAYRDIGVKMESIKERLSRVAIEKDKFHFALEGKSREESERLETTPLIDVSEVCGRDSVKTSLISMLCDDIEDASCPVVVSVLGMGGMGKTTLAQLAFNDEGVDEHFDYKIWICVSEPFDKTHIAKMIIETVMWSGWSNLQKQLQRSVGGKVLWSDSQKELQRSVEGKEFLWSDLQKELQICVEGKKFFLVLDDVRTDDFRQWEPIKIPLKSGAVGSRILVTTRNERVSKMMEATFILPLGNLSPEDSWTLFGRLAFYGKSREDRDNLEVIGRRIADRCKGLPLAIKTIGSLLRSKETKQAWKSVLDSELWELEEVEKGIFASLFLSYYDLSSPLKRCLTYCAIIPKDYNIEKNALIQQWMAQGFLASSRSVEMEQIGEEYFDNLAMRSFFQDLAVDREDPRVVTCKMHDIVHDFVQFLAKNECFIMNVDGKKKSKWDHLHKETHHLTLLGQMGQFHPAVYRLKNLRTLQVLQENTSTIPRDLFHCMTSLRQLDLSHTNIEELPSEVGRLLHLRKLNLSSLNLVQLPDTVSMLYNLQTLDLYCCRLLERLPSSLRKLINLRHLNIKETDRLSILPQGIGQLYNLRTLCKFIVKGKGEGCSISELKYLNDLRGDLEISGLENVMDIDEASEADLKYKEHLLSLDLVFALGAKEVMEKVIEAFEPPPNLEVLQVYDYGGSSFPNWLTLLTNLKDLKLLSCVNCERLPSLGRLPSLEKLLIGHFNSVKYVGLEFLGLDPVAERKDSTEPFIAFPKLKELTFRFMVEWEKWDLTSSAHADSCASSSSSNVSVTMRNAMPCLQSLSLYDCPKLIAVPQDLILMPPEELAITRCPIVEQQNINNASIDGFN